MIDTSVPAIRPVRRQARALLRGSALASGPGLLAFGLCLIGINGRSMWNDEYATWYAATLPVGDLLRLLGHVDAVLAPYYAVMHAWIALFGDAPGTLRLPSALAMAAAAGLVTGLGRRLCDTGVGVSAGLVFALLPAVSRYGQEARPYALAIAATLLATVLLVRALDRPEWSRWAGYGICLAAVGLIHIVAFTIVLPHALVAWRTMRVRDDLRMLRWAAAVAGAVTVVLPVAAKGHDESSAIDWIKADTSTVAHFPVRLFGSAPVAAALIGLGLLGAVLLWRLDRRASVLLLSWALIPPLCCYLTFPLLHLFLFRYLLFTVPAWVLLAAAVPYALIRRVREGPPPVWATLGVGLLTVSLVCALGMGGQHAARRSPVVGEPDFVGAARLVGARLRAGDAIAYGGSFRNGRRAFAYELRQRGQPADVLVSKSARQLGTFGALECENPRLCAATAQRIWLVTTALNPADPYAELPEPTAALLRLEFTGTELARLERAQVYLFTRTGGA